MRPDLYDLFHAEVSGENAKNMAADIWRHDVTMSFSEHAKSARYCVRKLKQAGASTAEIISFPATGRAVYGAYRLQRAWDARGAELHIVKPTAQARRLLSYRDNPYVLCQGSLPTPEGGMEAEVVLLEGGAKEADYKKVDVKGKVILTSGAPRGIQDMAARHGAVGIVTDHMATHPITRPTPMDLPDAHLWLNLRPEGKLWAFVLSPREGKELRAMVEAGKKKKEPVVLRAWVDAEPYDGEHEMVSACIKGHRQDQEIALIAHLYEPGCNDNASGVAALLEAIRSIKALIREGKLHRPYRTLRVWLVHEFQSLMAVAYEQPDAMERVIAAVNVDFVGQDQALCGSQLTYQMSPDALPSFIDHVTLDLMERFHSTFHTYSNAGSKEPYFATLQTPFWYNDNFISDPSIGVPSVALIQWPDRFYHTDHDTPDKLSPHSMGRATALTATWAWELANARLSEAMDYAELVADYGCDAIRKAAEKRIAQVKNSVPEVLEAEKQINDARKAYAEAWRDAQERVDYVRDRQLIALGTLPVLLGDSELPKAEAAMEAASDLLHSTAEIWQTRVHRKLAAFAREMKLGVDGPAEAKPLTKTEKRAAAIIPRRRVKGIVLNELFDEDVKKAIEKASKGGLPRLLLFWVDGERSLLDICNLTRLEGDGPAIQPARAIKWAEAMEKAGVLELREA
jgi:hypothetical protein